MPGRDDTNDVLIDAVREAGALALQYYGKSPKNWLKDNNTPLSEADLAVNDLLHDRLRTARPDYGWLSEETQDNADRLTCDHVWIVDPIDGTRAFLKGLPHWTISVALVAAGRPVLGAVFNPVENEFYHARINKGAMLNDKPIRTSDADTLSGCKLIVHDNVLKRDSWPKPWPELETGMRNSMAYRLCLVAQGRFDANLTMSPKSDWDIAAADLILHEAGGKVTNGNDENFIYNTVEFQHKPILAAGPKLHTQLLNYMS